MGSLWGASEIRLTASRGVPASSALAVSIRDTSRGVAIRRPFEPTAWIGLGHDPVHRAARSPAPTGATRPGSLPPEPASI